MIRAELGELRERGEELRVLAGGRVHARGADAAAGLLKRRFDVVILDEVDAAGALRGVS